MECTPDSSYLWIPSHFHRFYNLWFMVIDTTAVGVVARLMELAARTAPKVKGVDTILTRILIGKEVQDLAGHLADAGERRNIGFFIRDATNIAVSDACVIIGVKGASVAGINRGAYGYACCEELIKECKKCSVEFLFIPDASRRGCWNILRPVPAASQTTSHPAFGLRNIAIFDLIVPVGNR